MTRAQEAALRQLAAAPDGRCPTSTSTNGRYVGGPCAAGLKRRGWVRNVAIDMRTEQPCKPEELASAPVQWHVQITDEGRKALSDIAAARAAKRDPQNLRGERDADGEPGNASE